jgi:uncharacterized protein YdeI (YjbR/CyaY-like superfamily)
MKDNLPRLSFRNRDEWHAWLKENHRTSSGIYLVYYKKASRQPTITYEEAVQEALSFGWIDSTAHALDRDRYMQLFTSRKPGSSWSRLNKERVEKLIREGRMTPAGREKVEAALRDGSWTMLDKIEKLALPEDLAESLDASPRARAVFDGLPASTRKVIIRWIESARKQETRDKRIGRTISELGKGIRRFPFPE